MDALFSRVTLGCAAPQSGLAQGQASAPGQSDVQR